MRENEEKLNTVQMMQKLLKSERGSSILIVLSVILILTMLGASALISGYYNVALSTNYKNWSGDFFKADIEAEKKAKEIDGYLLEAEKYAMAYFENEWYRLDPTSVSPVFNTVLATPLDPATLNYFGLLSNQQNYLFQRYNSTPLLSSATAIAADPLAAASKMQSFVEDGFKKVYLLYAYNLLDYYQYLPTGHIMNPNITDPNINDIIAGTSVTWTDVSNTFVAQTGDVQALIKVTYKEPGSGATQIIDLSLDVRLPDMGTLVEEYSAVPIKGNPIWTNVLNANDGIVFSGTQQTSIIGDIYAPSVVEGIELLTNAKVRITGNTYTAGDVVLTGSNALLDTSPSLSGTLNPLGKSKDRIFGNVGYFFDVTGLGNLMSTYTGAMNINPSDTLGGSIYCNSFTIDELSVGATANIKGLLSTNDDLQVDGSGATVNLLAGTIDPSRATYIGLQSVGTLNDANASSSIINNAPNGFNENGNTSTININGGVLVPGVVHFGFFQKNINGSPSANLGDRFYRAAESVSANSLDLFGLYLTDEAGAEKDLGGMSSYYLLDATSTDPVYMKANGWENTGATVASRKAFMEPHVAAAHARNVNTQVRISNPSGYTLGNILAYEVTSPRVFIDPMYTVAGSNSFSNFTDTQTKYGTDKTDLLTAFGRRTVSLGVSGIHPMSDFVDLAAYPAITHANFIKNTTGVLDLASGNVSGILYRSGDLTITNTGATARTFEGTIICTGKLTVNTAAGDITLIHPDYSSSPTSIIYDTIMADASVKAFFAPGNLLLPANALDCYNKNPTVHYSVGTMNTQKRYKVIRWVESYEYKN